MDFDKKLLELQKNYPDLSSKYPDANSFELCIITLRDSKKSYGEIQKVLGNPSKKEIRRILKQFAPDLIEQELVCKNISEYTIEEGEFRYLLIKNRKWNYVLQDENFKFRIDNNHLMIIDDSGFIMRFSDLDIALRNQLLNELKDQLDETNRFNSV